MKENYNKFVDMLNDFFEEDCMGKCENFIFDKEDKIYDSSCRLCSVLIDLQRNLKKLED